MRKLEQQFNEYLEYCEKVRRMSGQTLRNKRWLCQNLLESLEANSMEEITNQDINNWIMAQTIRGCAGQTANIRIGAFKALARYFLDMGVGIPNLKIGFIIKQQEVPSRRVSYTREQIEQVLGLADQMEWLLIRICFDCGLRISELRNLRLADIDGRRVTFIGKGARAREVYLSEETRRRLDDWVAREEITDYIWEVKIADGTRRHLSVEEIRYRMKKSFRRAGFMDFYPHALRHSFATDVVGNGASLEIAKEMLGHANVATTERYVHSFEGHLGEYFDRYKFVSQK